MVRALTIYSSVLKKINPPVIEFRRGVEAVGSAGVSKEFYALDERWICKAVRRFLYDVQDLIDE